MFSSPFSEHPAELPLFDLQHSKPLGHHIDQLIQTCTPAIVVRPRTCASTGPYLSVVRGKEQAAASSKYPEDVSFPTSHFYVCLAIAHPFITVFINNHTSVWGCHRCGMTQGQVHGAMCVVTPPCISHTALARSESMLPQHRVHRIHS